MDHEPREGGRGGIKIRMDHGNILDPKTALRAQVYRRFRMERFPYLWRGGWIAFGLNFWTRSAIESILSMIFVFYFTSICTAGFISCSLYDYNSCNC